MTIEEKEASRQRQTWFTWLLVAIMMLGLFLFVLLGIAIEGLREAVVGTIWALMGHEGANKFSTPKGRH